ncbi:MAG: heparinase II/III family protein [Candidatus Marinimicrobia bacterium]|nr:heparinase II/III family protein [Candidatus Neomarinimicrobiota bacterium]
MISNSEFKAFTRVAWREREFFLLIKLALNLYSDAFRKWRWRKGIFLSRSSAVKSEESDSVQSRKNKGPDKWSGSYRAIQKNAQSFFKPGFTFAPKYEDGTFRAAGGKRLPLNNPSDDVQDKHAWHRLYWLLDSSAEQTDAFLEHWLKEDLDQIAMHPYTVSERIHNMCEWIGGNKVSDDLLEPLIDQIFNDAAWLNSHVESKLGIHNHLLNNARALYIAATIFEEDARSRIWLETARSLWVTLWPRLILADGCFAEQSSYYHILMTRTVLEFLAAAQLHDWILPDNFMEKAERMGRITNLLMRTDGSFPIFGDASPDMPSVWLRGLPQVCFDAGLMTDSVRDGIRAYAGGVSHIGSAILTSQKNGVENSGGPSGWSHEHFNEGGFLFCRNDKLGLELSAYGFTGSELHGHSDTGQGSFEIWWKGRKIVIDGGVPVYGTSEAALFFKGGRGQNGITLDGIPPVPLKSDSVHLPTWYTFLHKQGEWKVIDGEAEFTCFGFSRYHSEIIWRRTWKWEAQSISIIDYICGLNRKTAFRAYLHFGENEWEVIGKDRFQNKNCILNIAGADSTKSSLVKMSHSPDYGNIKESQGIIVSDQIKSSLSLRWTFDFSSGNTNS